MSVVPSAERALAILTYLGTQANPVPASTIARVVNLPRSTTYHLLDTLIAADFVTHYPEHKLYGLGLTAYELSSGYMRQAPLQRLARKPMADLCDRVRHSAHLSVLLGREIVYVIEERAPHRPLLITDVGVRLPAHLTASGRAILAALPPPHVRALYPTKEAFSRDGGRGPDSPTALRQRLNDIHHDGYSTEHGEVSPGLASAAMAVFDPHGYPLAAVAVTYPIEDHTPALLNLIIGEVRATARELGRRISD